MTHPLPLTEQSHPRSQDLDCLDIPALIDFMRDEDQRMLQAFEGITPALTDVIRAVVPRLQGGGRLIYLGAGTSGRLGVLDAAECPPTFRTPPGLVCGVIAGGRTALEQAVEGAEDDVAAAVRDLQALQLTAEDVLIGIAASGTTPYVRAGLRFGHQQGALTALIACTPVSQDDPAVNHFLILETGPEVIAGSTRLKAGTATKLILNMISTITMIQLGKVYGHYMVDLTISNAKLKRRALRMICELTDLEPLQAQGLLDQAQGEVKTALMAYWGNCTPVEARARLAAAGGHLRRAMQAGCQP
jgi:N-acetylmuramic acid 6-phosphate etherase